MTEIQTHQYFYVCAGSLQGYEENQMKNEGARVITTFYSDILDAQGQLNL